jgi:hypothetical protein
MNKPLIFLLRIVFMRKKFTFEIIFLLDKKINRKEKESLKKSYPHLYNLSWNLKYLSLNFLFRLEK